MTAEAPCLVTGASGWLGRSLILALARGLPEVPGLAAPFASRVRCLVRTDEDAARLRALGPEFETVLGDLLDPDSLARFTRQADGGALFHCAGLIHPRLWSADFFRVNFEGAKNLLAAATAAGTRRFIYVSSSAAAGPNPDPARPLSEADPPRPYLGYGLSKSKAEQAARQAHAGALETVIVRAPWFYGPGQPARQTRFFAMIKSGRAPLLGAGSNLRSMVYLDNLCQALILCARVPAAGGQIYWIADREPYRMSSILDTIAGVMERDFKLPVVRTQRHFPAVLGDLAELFDRGLQALGLYQQDLHVLSEMNKNIYCSIAKAQQELGYHPTVELAEGMRRSIQWLYENDLPL